MAKSRTVRSGIWQLENNVPLQSGTLGKRLKLHSERRLSRICRNPRVRLSEKKEPRLHERSETAEDKGQLNSSSLLLIGSFATISDLFPAASSSTFTRARFAPLLSATSSALLPATLV
jgi:hypothetical protein